MSKRQSGRRSGKTSPPGNRDQASNNNDEIAIPKQTVYIGLAVLVVAVIISALALAPNLFGGAPSAVTVSDGAGSRELISPAGYVNDFASSTDHILVDVRTPEEVADGYIDGAINIPVDELEARLSELPDDAPVVVYCRSGNRSARAANILASNGYEAYDLGGIITWEAQGYPVVGQ
ncbi:MAG: rhodanese-like domain-containing protein [Chloroflexi bacterium]|nr:rhodanese-like domain-containing protein [Chloroflexota bacterium]